MKRAIRNGAQERANARGLKERTQTPLQAEFLSIPMIAQTEGFRKPSDIPREPISLHDDTRSRELGSGDE